MASRTPGAPYLYLADQRRTFRPGENSAAQPREAQGLEGTKGPLQSHLRKGGFRAPAKGLSNVASNTRSGLSTQNSGLGLRSVLSPSPFRIPGCTTLSRYGMHFF